MNALALRSQPRLAPSPSLPAAVERRAHSAAEPRPASRPQVQPGLERVDARAQARLGSPLAPVAERVPGATPSDPFAGLRDEALERAIQASSSNKRVLSYDGARKAIFGDLDVVNGKVRDVYTHREIRGGRVPNSSDMNVEHTWPQSKGATGAAKSDLHHLFPTDSKANSTRSSFPFGEVVDVKWSHPSGAKLGKDAQGRTVFEPPDEHKGNVARAMFYFSATYNKSIPQAEEAVLKQWNKLDGVDTAELARSRRIAELQGNRNPFVEDAALADRIRDF